MQFMSPKNTGFVAHIKDPEEQYFPDGRSRQIRPALVADFADQSLGMQRYGGYDDPQGINSRKEYTAVIGGGFFDTEVAAKRYGWTDEEHQIVVDHLTWLATDPPVGMEGDVKLYEAPKALPPWPTYDKMHHNEIPAFAKDTGLVEQALAYEQRTKNRPALVAKLTELRELEVGEESLTAA